jgi:hypothetical protein
MPGSVASMPNKGLPVTMARLSTPETGVPTSSLGERLPAWWI